MENLPLKVEASGVVKQEKVEASGVVQTSSAGGVRGSTPARGRLSSLRGGKPTFAPKIPSAGVAPPPMAVVKKERDYKKRDQDRGARGARGRGRGARDRGSAPIPAAVVLKRGPDAGVAAPPVVMSM